jgi:hypothetical protein
MTSKENLNENLHKSISGIFGDKKPWVPIAML